MLGLSGGDIYFYRAPVNMHKSFEGLSGIVEFAFPGKLLSSAYFVFLNRRRTKMKVLHWAEGGFEIWYKRLEKGTFSINKDGKTKLTRREFFMLLEGIKPKRLNSRFFIKKSD